MPQKKSREKKRAASPVDDLEFQEAADTVPDQETAGEEAKNVDKLIFRIRKASSDIYKETKRPPTNQEISEVLDEDLQKIKSARDSLKLARKNQRLTVLRKKALQAGYVRRSDMSRAESRGLDMERTLLTPGDIKRLVRALPMSFADGSYNHEEAKMRIELMSETLPLGSAREITAFLEPHFRNVINECVKQNMRSRTQRISAATMYSVISKYDNGVFTGVSPPEGLVKFCKQNCTDFNLRGDKQSGKLFKASSKDGQKWKADKSKNKQLDAEFKEKQLEDQKASKKRVKNEDEGNEDAEENEVEPEVVEEPKKKKKKKPKSSD